MMKSNFSIAKIIYALFSITLGLLLCTCDAPDSNDNLDLIAPTDLVATATSDTVIELSWKDNSDYEYGFRLERDSGNGFGLLATINANTTEYIDLDVMSDSTYRYRIQAFANYKEPSAWSSIAIASTLFVVDIDGNSYTTVRIGNQIWMAENLKVTHFRDAIPLPNLITDWSFTAFPAYCHYDNYNENGNIFGELYNGFAVMSGRILAPEGWHIPSQAEWQTLIDHLGGESVAVEKLIADQFSIKSGSETNLSGFTALLAGWRIGEYGYFTDMGFVGKFWTNTEDASNKSLVYYQHLDIYNSGTTFQAIASKLDGLSIRCIKD